MLKESRKKIDVIDEKIIRLLKERTDLVKEIGHEKEKESLPIVDLEREKEVLEKIKAVAKEKNIDEEIVEKIFKDIIEYSKEIQKRAN